MLPHIGAIGLCNQCSTFYMGMEIQTQVLVFHKQALLTPEPSPWPSVTYSYYCGTTHHSGTSTEPCEWQPPVSKARVSVRWRLPGSWSCAVCSATVQAEPALLWTWLGAPGWAFATDPSSSHCPWGVGLYPHRKELSWLLPSLCGFWIIGKLLSFVKWCSP